MTADEQFFYENAGTSYDPLKEYDYEDEPETCESCVMWDAEGIHVLASLGCIDDATEEYRRVIQAELALEAMHAERLLDRAMAI